MSKDQKEFFDELKPWARFKNFILDYYLGPYLLKVKELRRPILLVDCCSGPGKFKDGNNGSPLIMALHLQKMRDRGVNCRGIFIERNKKWCQELTQNLSPYSSCCEAKQGDFKQFWNEIYNLTKTHTVFVYVDPFGVEDLAFNNFASLLGAIQEGVSVELLLNWNCIGFLRWGLQCLKGKSKAEEIFSTIDSQYVELGEQSTDDKNILNEIANGDYWQSILTSQDPADLRECEHKMVMAYLNQFQNNLLKGNYPIVPRYGLIPKYHMIFVTGNYHGFELMNDTMAKARVKALHDEFIKDFLFDTTPDVVREDLKLLPERIRDLIRNYPNRLFKPEIKEMLMGQLGMFAKYEDKMFTEALRKLRKEKQVSPNKGQAILKVRYTVN